MYPTLIFVFTTVLALFITHRLLPKVMAFLRIEKRKGNKNALKFLVTLVTLYVVFAALTPIMFAIMLTIPFSIASWLS